MNREYFEEVLSKLKLDRKTLYNELINFEISLADMVEEYDLPSEKWLRELIRDYCNRSKGELQLPRQIELMQDDKNDIYERYMAGETVKSICESYEVYGVSSYIVEKIVKETKKARNEENRKRNKKSKTLDPKTIKKAVEAAMDIRKSYVEIQRTYGVPYWIIKDWLSKTEEGRKVIEERAKKKRKISISLEKAIETYTDAEGWKSQNWKEFGKYGNQRVIHVLQEGVGLDYVKVLRGNSDDIKKKYVEAYLEGKSYDEIAEEENKKKSDKDKKTSKEMIRRKVKEYFDEKGEIVPGIVEKEDFEKYMDEYRKTHSAIEIEKIEQYYKKKREHVPESYIEEYLKKTGKVDLRKVKHIISNELGKLKKQGKTPNYTAPADFAGKIKQKGYGTNYIACAYLYRLIKDNNLSADVAESLENEEVTEAINILMDKKRKPMELKLNKIAYVIDTVEKQSTNSDEQELR